MMKMWERKEKIRKKTDVIEVEESFAISWLVILVLEKGKT